MSMRFMGSLHVCISYDKFVYKKGFEKNVVVFFFFLKECSKLSADIIKLPQYVVKSQNNGKY